MESSVDEEALHQLYLWVDNIPLSRPKRNLSRDFSDGVLVAELIKFYFPKMVEMHNYVPANSLQQKSWVLAPYRSWFLRIAVATWIWVCPRRFEEMPQPWESSSERAIRWLPDPLGITRRCRGIRTSSSRSLKRSRSCWPLKRQYRSFR
ncbi:rCG26209, isoform CRA_b [Rattus norvegicus]|uniref:RCG26209, isoform CRA_b n=1 Tax=Rattus norvegicus TaxID=10116 RepID=A6HQC6_RAT|nr:rCG26209, isoform CRA_b [Rattus norvegicus]